MASYEQIDNLLDFLDEVSKEGMKTAWFLRDLHWLSGESGIMALKNRAEAAIQSRGLYELEQLSRRIDTLYVPCEASGRHFRDLLAGKVYFPFVKPLPPGLTLKPEPQFPSAADLSESAVTLLYTGGVGGVYDLSRFVGALGALEPELSNGILVADFVVREEERDTLDKWIAANGLAGSSSIRVLTLPEVDYRPRTQRVAGVVDLASDYGGSSFPYKTMTYLERGYPVLTTERMAVATFIGDNDFGWVAPATSEGIADTIRVKVLQAEWPTVSDSTLAEHTWDTRWSAVTSA